MTLDLLLGGVSVVLLMAGCALATIGIYGLIVKPDIFEQLHVAGLVTGPGVVLVLLASIGTGRAEIVTSAVLVLAFVLVTSSISTHVIAHAGARRYAEAPRQRPPTGDDRAPDLAGGPVAVAHRGQARSSGMRVVIGHDGSPSADVATDLATAIDWQPGTVIRIVAAAAPSDLPPLDPWSMRGPDDDASDRPTTSDQTLRRAAQAMQRPGIQVETAVVQGDPTDVILEETAAFAADLLIVGSRGRGFVQSLLGWSAAGEILGGVPCPVLVASSRSLRAVMVATDGSAPSAAAVELVSRWPIFDRARIHVVTVSTGPAPAEGSAADGSAAAGPEAAADRRTVDATAGWLMDAGRDAVAEVLSGRPGAAIVEAAHRHGVDLVVIGSRGRTGLGRTLLGSVAGEVLGSATCSVLIVGPPVRRPPGAS